MKKSLLFFFCIVHTSFSFSQSKTNFAIAKQIAENSSNKIGVFVKGDIQTIKSLTEINNGIFKYSSGNIAEIEIEANKLSQFITNKNIERVEAYPSHIKPLNDTMIINNNVVPVHAGQSPLTQAYKGDGILIGFIDTGIDFTHPDFQDSTGKSRIKFLWDQKLATGGTTPLPYNYGQEWTGAQIDLGQAAAHNDLAYAGHGTHVISIAAGNGYANGTHKGVAPNADIIVVAFDFSSTSYTKMTDAVNYIYSKAQQLGKPCVINASLGDYYGSHDGLDLQAQLIKNMMNAKPGRAFVAAAGNEGNNAIHLGYSVSSDTNFTFFNYVSSSIYIQLWADTADLKNVSFSIGASKFSPNYSDRGRIPFSNINNHLGFLSRDTLYNNGNRIGIVESYGDLVGSTYSMEYNIIPDSINYKWRLFTTGSGKFDLWSFDMVSTNLPSPNVMTDSIYYKSPDFAQNIVSSFQCLDDVLTVANYSNRKQYIDYNNQLYVRPDNIAGDIHVTSSKGPTRDGRIKPDISSPGDMTVAAVVLSLRPGIIANYPEALAPGGYHVASGGTSHACPGVAGVAALYLQQNPTATASMVHQAIINCARQDSFTGTSLPNNSWGYGKVDAYNALTQCSLVGINEHNNQASFKVYPNPNAKGNNLTIELKDSFKKPAEIKIYNTLGELVKTITLQSNQTILETNLDAGIYIFDLIENNTKLASEKIIIL